MTPFGPESREIGNSPDQEKEQSRSEERGTVRLCQGDQDGDYQDRLTGATNQNTISPDRREGRAFAEGRECESPDPDNPVTAHETAVKVVDESPTVAACLETDNVTKKGKQYDGDGEECQLPQELQPDQAEIYEVKNDDYEFSKVGDENGFGELDKNENDSQNSFSESKLFEHDINNDVKRQATQEKPRQLLRSYRKSRKISTGSSSKIALSVPKFDLSKQTFGSERQQNFRKRKISENPTSKSKKIKLHAKEMLSDHAQKPGIKSDLPTDKSASFKKLTKSANEKSKRMKKMRQKLQRKNRSTHKGKRHAHVKIFSEPRINLEKRNNILTNTFRMLLLFIISYSPGIMSQWLKYLDRNFKQSNIQILENFVKVNTDKRERIAKKAMEREMRKLLKCAKRKKDCSNTIFHVLLNSKKFKQILRKLNKNFPTHQFSAIVDLYNKINPVQEPSPKNDSKTVKRDLASHLDCTTCPKQLPCSQNTCKKVSTDLVNHSELTITSQQITWSESAEKLLLAPPERRQQDTRNQFFQSPYNQSQQLRQVASDGRVSDDARDPPGQQSIYIPPGDNRNEQYRLSTFEQFPVTSPTSRKSLAKSGFYFTGFYDRVKCFACGRTVERWVETDNPADNRWHKENCPFKRGEDCGNVPIRSLFSGLNFTGSRSAAQRSSGQTEQVLQQVDPVTGAVTRVVRYPADLPERVRQTGGTFQLGPNNTVLIQNGPGTNRGRLPGAQQAPMPPNQWRMANVISSDHRRFLTNLFLNRELDRVASFARWPVGRPNVSPAALARTGFFYLGDMDRTQCFSCGGVLRNWTLEDDAENEHRSHFPACPMVLGTENRNIRVPEYPDAPDERERNFPCRFPSNPHMRSLAAREETFDRRWPVGRTAATPAEISQAGFFFLGERDRVKCWYCNGGLQHWEYDDMPWIEHAKWFPTCQFLLSVKGQHFVYRHLTVSPHLARPIIARQDGSPLEGVNPPARAQDIPPSVSRVRQPSPPPTIIDPQEEMRKRKEKVEKLIKESEVVKNVLTMGFSERIVRILLEEKLEAGAEANSQEIYDSVATLLDDVMKKEQELEREEQEARNRRINAVATNQGTASMAFPSTSSVYSSATTPGSSLGPAPGSGRFNVSLFNENDEDEPMDQDMYGSMAGTSSGETPAKQIQGQDETSASLQEQLNKIEEERMCKICFSNPADMVFVPCGHMCCCMQCTQAITQCPMCRKKIQKAIKTYLS